MTCRSWLCVVCCVWFRWSCVDSRREFRHDRRRLFVVVCLLVCVMFVVCFCFLVACGLLFVVC